MGPTGRTKLSEATIPKLLPPPGKVQGLFWDEELANFGVVVGRNAKTFIIDYRDASKAKRRLVIGRHGVDRGDGHRWNVTMARKRAKELLGQVAAGRDPAGGTSAPGWTLAKGLDLHVSKMRKAKDRPRSISTIEREVRTYLSGWLDRPLGDITRVQCRERHEELSDDSGPYVANRTFRHLRAIWNTSLAERDLPANPTIAVHWNKEHRRQQPIPWEDLPAWWSTVCRLDPIRSAYNRVVLLTGLRSMDAATLRWPHVDLTARTVLRPNPKGGEDRAFTIPISQYVADLLEERKEHNLVVFGGDGGWCFPTRCTKDKACDHCSELGLEGHSKGAAVHMTHPKEQRTDEATKAKTTILPTPHRLRDTYTTACVEAGLSPYEIDVLTNHRPPRGSVTAGYINLSLEHLAQCQQRVTEYLLGKVEPAG